MSAAPVTRILDGNSVTSTPLPPMRALDLVPELTSLMDTNAATDMAMFVGIARAMGGGKLRKLLPDLLAGTRITVTENGAPVGITLNTCESIDMALDGRMGILPDLVAFALEVTYKDFFGGLARIAKSIQKASP